jgi:diguanylate cyclase (GGDEF)-like protein
MLSRLLFRPARFQLPAVSFSMLSAVLSVLAVLAIAASAEEPAGQLPTMTTARQAHGLTSSEAARGYPIHLRAVITYFEPTIVNDGWVGMFVHDSTGSIFVFVKSGTVDPILPGTLIDLRGITAPGWFAPVVAHPQIEVIGYAGLPASPHRPSFAQLFSGSEDAQWIELEGVVHSIVDENGHIILQMIMDDRPITVNMGSEPGAAYSGLIDSKIRIRGNAGAVYDAKHTHMIGVRLTCPNLSAVQILEAPSSDPFKLKPVSIDKLLHWDLVPLLAHRVHLQGRVTLQWPGTSVCIQDATQGICAQTGQNTRLRNGELIDIAGFVRAEGSAPTLNDAVFKSSDSSADVPVEAVPATADEILAGGHDSQLIHIDGQLVSRDLSSSDTTLLVNSGKFIFKAILPQSMSGQESKEWQNGSLLRITGISSVQIEEQRSGLRFVTAAPTTFQVRLRMPADVVVLKRPSWWTPPHALIVLAVALAGTLVVLGWVTLLRKRLRESEERFRHMALHDALTGLATRLLLNDHLSSAVETAKRHETGLALLMVDVDKFKEINDTFGHHGGDEVLRVTASRLTQAVRKTDTVARMGGDEFVVLLTDLGDPVMAEEIAAKIIKSLAEPVLFAGREIHVSVSVGVCSSDAGGLDEETLLKCADAALYQAKAKGRNCFHVARSGQQSMRTLLPSL